MIDFESRLPNEELDSAEILRGILTVQRAFAAAQKRPLGRGTHTKGICARATFEVFDVRSRMTDPALAGRLAQGIYAKPGVYPATVRFANAASTIYADRAPDLRALSFSVEVPGQGGPAYQDYSMQSATTFPINDAHVFAVLMRVLSAPTSAQKLKTILSLPLMDKLRFAKGAALGRMQEHPGTHAYQQIRYWSTVPFRNGPMDAVKYSATPSAGNPAHPLAEGPNELQDELIRHLNEDEQMSSWEIGLQLLDTTRMTHLGLRRSASFWVENATAEWKESQSPFYPVARLTLLPKSAMAPEECEPRFIDVTEHSTPNAQPLGSINRVRHATELASRKVRLGQITAEALMDQLPIAPPAPRSLPRTLAKAAGAAVVALLVWAFVVYPLAGFVYWRAARKNLPPQQQVDQVVYLNQGWGDGREAAARQLFYYTPQGTGMHGIRYSWFVNLEEPFRRVRLAAPKQMRALNFVVDPPTAANPDQLPVGFARRYDSAIHDNVVDITCSACHTGQLLYTQNGTTTAVRIDGGEAMTAFTDEKPGSFQVDLLLSMTDTLLNVPKFNRFAAAVLGQDDSAGNKAKLWFTMAGVMGQLGRTGLGSSNPGHYPLQEGYGRTDALARIGNVVFGDHITPKNYTKGDGPVSYPYLWDIWKFNWVQYNASVSQPLARNTGESLGVGANFTLRDQYGRPTPENEQYDTSTDFPNLERIEDTLQELQPPVWPAEVFGPIDHDKWLKGQILFNSICARCHGPHVASATLKEATAPGRLKDDPLWVIRTLAVRPGEPGMTGVRVVGTDPTAADNFAKNEVDLSAAGITLEQVRALLGPVYEEQVQRYRNFIPDLTKEIAAHKGADPATLAEYNLELKEVQEDPVTEESATHDLDQLDIHHIPMGIALSVVGELMRNKYFHDHDLTAQQQACLDGFDTLDLPQIEAGYKPRPLRGVWATPPFLHDGSVPNLYEMLVPARQRPKKFYLGTLEFDPKYVGYQYTKGQSSGFWMDTTKAGNENIGHSFDSSYNAASPSQSPSGVIGPLLTDEQRWDIVEYLKDVQQDETPTRTPVNCLSPEQAVPAPPLGVAATAPTE
ncbi:MAG TPA: di-heme-cytochrome C peroxidase [Acidobacteriaceae bacterium]|jgi:mono/diheme cytochrome c family protein|nr:di-heme-cytochrome C peroxidase [Acidobacteriaceae bacterium]